MTIYVDGTEFYPKDMVKARAKKYGGNWCHLMADSEEELHTFAATLGLKRDWFQPKSMPHYDLTPKMRLLAIQLGAVETTTCEMVMKAMERRKAQNEQL